MEEERLKMQTRSPFENAAYTKARNWVLPPLLVGSPLLYTVIVDDHWNRYLTRLTKASFFFEIQPVQ